MQKKYVIQLTSDERIALEKISRDSKQNAKKVIKSKILLKIDKSKEGCSWTDAQIKEAFGIDKKTVYRLRQRFVEEGYEAALSRKTYPKVMRRKFDGEQEAQLIALCCSAPPEGYARWSLRLLSDKVVELEMVESVSPETLRQTLKKMNLNLG